MARQCCLFEFETKTAEGRKALLDGKNHCVMGYDYARIIAQDLGKFPSGEGWFNRAFVIEHDKTYDRGLKNWDVKHCFQRNSWRIMKLLNRRGEVYDRIDVANVLAQMTYSNIQHDYRKIIAAVVKDDLFIITTEEGTEWTIDLVETKIDRCDMIEYDPSKHKDDLLIECLKRQLPDEDIEEVMKAPCYFDYYTPERLIESKSRIPEIIEKCGFTPRFRQDVPVLKPDFEYNPIDKKCKSCLFKTKNGCRKDLSCDYWCSQWIWNRKPFKSSASRKNKKTLKDEEEDDTSSES